MAGRSGMWRKMARRSGTLSNGPRDAGPPSSLSISYHAGQFPPIPAMSSYVPQHPVKANHFGPGDMGIESHDFICTG